jgi:hypothetical protein
MLDGAGLSKSSQSSNYASSSPCKDSGSAPRTDDSPTNSGHCRDEYREKFPTTNVGRLIEFENTIEFWQGKLPFEQEQCDPEGISTAAQPHVC